MKNRRQRVQAPQENGGLRKSDFMSDKRRSPMKEAGGR